MKRIMGNLSTLVAYFRLLCDKRTDNASVDATFTGRIMMCDANDINEAAKELRHYNRVVLPYAHGGMTKADAWLARNWAGTKVW